ncbi:dehydrodolichyl diphosphate synthetase [Rhizoctonia solani AG-1 IA]|uniref:Dehydrodolichyl diphosphate synthetase n=1 Tax=Thanatephorus cucumeris (strain AG1-IA) TaxID=983506 RepID=L8WJW3_THACA|nr:dehydrodolichyl diphosphate synthetase [Rhizoctonia solani AG-1 IA]
MGVINFIVDWLTRLVIYILSAGPVPQHVAFVMDGNRRYARHKQVEVSEGHTDGFGMLEICLRLGIKCVTVYAFSIENFKRPRGEVDTLMTLAKNKLDELCSHGDLLDKYQVRLNVLGKTELLPPDVLEVVHRAEAMTAKHNGAILNICMPYTSREEITSAVESIVRSHQSGEIELDDITPETLEARLYTKLRDSPKLDILVRTSGVHRLSDFLLWQVRLGLSPSFCFIKWCAGMCGHANTLFQRLLAGFCSQRPRTSIIRLPKEAMGLLILFSQLVATTDHPDDPKSRWSTERHGDPGIQESQWVMLSLEKPSVVSPSNSLSSHIGISDEADAQFMKAHPCNVSAFKVYGGLGTKDSEMHELIRGKLRDDDIPQTFTLNYKTPGAGVPFPCRYIKICPISYVWLEIEEGFVKRVYDNYIKHKETLALHLILKHLRRSNFLDAHTSLLAQTGLRTEHPKITQLHDALVLNADLVTTEALVKSIAGEEGLFEHCARVSPPACVWKRITPGGDSGRTPVGRGGHQLCLDVERGVIYLFGGWDGSKNLSDFWSYTTSTNQWKLIHEDTAAVGGPSARSCHNMVYCHTNRTLYVLGQLKDQPRPNGGNPQPQRADAEFFKCSLDATGEGGTWTLLNPSGVEASGGPHSISDHQMIIDEENSLMYVFGGRMEHISDRDGIHDPARNDGPSPNPINIYSRTDIHCWWTTVESTLGARHVLVYTHHARYPTDPTGPINYTLRDRVEDRTRADPATFMTYHIEKKLWVRSEPRIGPLRPSPSGDVWESLELPRPRSAHQEADWVRFGGNSGEDGIPRLNDLWSMRLVRRVFLSLRAPLSIYRFKLMCDTVPPFEALTYLQTEVSEVVDSDEELEAANLRSLLSYLLSRTSDGDTTMNGDGAKANEATRKERRELFDFLMQFVDPAEREPETELRDIVENV